MSAGNKFDKLLAFLQRLPAIDLSEPIGRGGSKSGNWWVKFRLDTNHDLAWRHVQELGFVLNWVSVTEPLPTLFKPVSPPPYLNGGEEFLMWVIESTDPSFTPDQCAEWLEGRLPKPVDNPDEWKMDEAQTEGIAVETRYERRLPDLEDCEQVGQKHKWFNLDGARSGCYNCRVVREGQLWRRK